jgi:hypothetical protein
MTFLDLIWPYDPELWGEIRIICNRHDDNHRADQFWLRLDGTQTAQAHVIAETWGPRGYDIYFGVLPRVRGRGGARDCITTTNVLWADVDAKKTDADTLLGGKLRTLEAIAALPTQPQVLVDSGGGHHAYWLLREPIPYVEARELMVDIADRVGGDRVQDAPRILRLPGTANWKREPHVEARLLRFEPDAPRYRPCDFYDLARPVFTRKTNGSIPVRLSDVLPDWLDELIEQGAPKGSRSEAAFKVCIWLARYGWSDPDIRTVFEANPCGIGAKWFEKENKSWGDGDRWLEVTLAAARREA